nr:Putative Glycosyltransferase [Raoultella sp. NCTC 9187]
MSNKMNVGIIADWLVSYAGAERVIQEMIDIYPDSKLYAVIDFLSNNARENFHGNELKLLLFKKCLFLRLLTRSIFR